MNYAIMKKARYYSDIVADSDVGPTRLSVYDEIGKRFYYSYTFLTEIPMSIKIEDLLERRLKDVLCYILRIGSWIGGDVMVILCYP